MAGPEPAGSPPSASGGVERFAIELPVRDGRPVLCRPIRPDDGDRLRDGFARLSARSRYLRFMTSMPHLPDEQVEYLTNVDYHDHMAWVAVDPTDSAHPGLGVARYIRVPGEPTVAEAAVTVVDEHQGRGIGTVLVGLLALSARQNGIDTFRAYVLGENHPMLEILRDLGATASHEEGSLLRVDVPLPEDPQDLPDTPTGRVLEAVAKRMLPPFTLGFRGPQGPLLPQP